MSAAAHRPDVEAPGVRVAWPEPGIAKVTLDAPPANQLDASIRRALIAALTTLAREDGLRAVVLTGAGGRFSAGNDLSELGALEPSDWPEFVRGWGVVFDALEHFPVPTIAAVERYAMGGGFELVLCCDLRVVSDDAVLSCTAAHMGLLSRSDRLVRDIGASRARALLYLSPRIDAAEALQIGLVHAVSASGDLEQAALTLARGVARQPPLAIRQAKALLLEQEDRASSGFDERHRAALVALGAGTEHRAAAAALLGRASGAQTARGAG